MAIQDPQKPWAVVLCSIEGSAPQSSLVDVFRGFFSPSATHSTIVDFWKDSTMGLVDLSASEVFGWYDSGYTMIGSGGLSPYIGISEGGPSPLRGDLVAHARAILQQNNPGLDLSRFRSILAVYNFDLNAGQSGTDVVYGLLPGPLSWAQRNWSQCGTCSGLFRLDAAASVCAASVGSTPFGHTRTDDEVQVPNVPTLLSGLGGFSMCRRCGVLYEVARSNGCPAGGAHADDGSRLFLPNNWASTFGSHDWQRCQDCGLVLKPGSQFLCPVTRKAHVTLSEKFSFSKVVLATPSLSWMCHEMGHAYGFIHGRSSDPASKDFADDASPGAYGDRYDVMSYDNCAYFTDDQGYQAGPALATHQLLPMTAVPVQVFDPSKGFDSIVIRTPDSSGSEPMLARMGNFVAKLRMHGDPLGRPGWDRALDFGDPSNLAGVLVHNLEPFAPTLMTSIKGKPYLLEGERFLSRDGAGTIAIEVNHIDQDSRTARLTVWNQNTLATGALQRWLVIPCTYSGDPTRGATKDELDSLLQDVEGYWNDVSGGVANIGGHYILQPARAGILRYVVPATAAAVKDQTPAQRIQTLMEVVRNDSALCNPTHSRIFLFHASWTGAGLPGSS